MNNNNSNFQESLKYDINKDRNTFNSVYSELFSYLKQLDIPSQKKEPSITKESYLSNIPVDNSNFELSNFACIKIEQYIKTLSNPKYKKFLDNKKIPSRSAKPDFSNLDEKEKNKQISIFEKKLAEEDINIRLMTYIKELVKQYLIYHDHDIRRYHINLCTHILLSYCRTHPLEHTNIHFRFKSPKGLITKLAKNIILDGHFERNPKTQTDEFKFKEISDAFGAKIVSSKGYNPKASNNAEIKKLIVERDKNLSHLADFELFQENIENYVNGYKSSEVITYRKYFDTCIDVLKSIISLINVKETDFIAYINSKIDIINSEKISLDTTANLDDAITNFDIFEKPNFNFKKFCTIYSQRISAPLTLKGLKVGLNKFFYEPGVSNQEILEKRILDAFRIKIFKVDNKHTSSGHEGIHIDILTPYGKFEFQVQDESQYVSDQIGETNAHMLMDNKDVPLFPIPRTYEKSAILDDLSNYIVINNSKAQALYFKKTEIETFIRQVECISAYKGKISYNRALNNAQVELYSSFYNYNSLAMEIPDTHSKKAEILEYFRKLSEKSGSVRKVIFHHTDPIVSHMQISQIRDYIFSIQSSLPVSQDSPTEEILL